MKSAHTKKLLIEELKKKPSIEAACRTAGIGRTAFYDWKKKDPRFAKAVELALQFGKAFMADIAELQLFNAIKNNDFRAIALYLKTHHPEYGNKVEISGQVTHERRAPTQKDNEDLAKAMLAAQPQQVRTDEHGNNT